MGRGGIVDGSFLRDFFPVPALFVCSDPVCAGLRVPPWLGGDSFAGAPPAFQPAAAPGWRCYFHFLLVEHVGSRSNGTLPAQPALNFFAEDSRHHSGARNPRIP